MRNFNEAGQMTLAYFISTLVYMIVINLISEEELITTLSSLRKEWIATFVFSLVLLCLIAILKIRFRIFFIFLGIIFFLFIPLTINRESLWNSWASTEDTPRFIYLTAYSFVTTIPFHGLIWSLVGYKRLEFLNIVFPSYLLIMGILGYGITKIRDMIRK